MITIYHNPVARSRARRSRWSKSAAQRLGEPVEVVEYLKQPPALATLRQLHTMLGVPVREMLRSNEDIYRELDLADPGLTDAELLAAVADNPILLQRPVVVRNRQAAIGRPPEAVSALLG